jgi:hypothetical protein
MIFARGNIIAISPSENTFCGCLSTTRTAPPPIDALALRFLTAQRIAERVVGKGLVVAADVVEELAEAERGRDAPLERLCRVRQKRPHARDFGLARRRPLAHGEAAMGLAKVGRDFERPPETADGLLEAAEGAQRKAEPAPAFGEFGFERHRLAMMADRFFEVAQTLRPCGGRLPARSAPAASPGA